MLNIHDIPQPYIGLIHCGIKWRQGAGFVCLDFLKIDKSGRLLFSKMSESRQGIWCAVYSVVNLRWVVQLLSSM